MPEVAGVHDLRTPALGLAAWAGGLGALAVPGWAALAAAVTLAVLALTRRGAARRVLMAWLLLALVAGAAAHLRELAVRADPVARLAEERAAAQLRLTVTSDPREVRSRFDPGVMLRATVTAVEGNEAHAPVLLFGGEEWAGVALGSELAADARLAPSEDGDLSAVVSARSPPRLVHPPGPLWLGAERVRDEIRGAVAGDGPARALVPALVVGDDSGLPEQVQADFRTAGLTHLLAVSGTNLTLVVGFLVVVGRWCGVRGRWLQVLGVAGIVGFVLLARTEPSVVRAAAMGAVGLLALGSNGRDRGARALGVAVTVLVLWDPWISVSAGFALSVLATGGILFLAPVWRDALARWMPAWLAGAVAVPLAAQVVCTPVVAAISGEVSLVAVAANLVAAPLVAPATVGGLLGGVAGLVADPLGKVPGQLAVWCASGIVTVAARSARLALPSVDWGTGWPALVLLTLLCALVAWRAERVLAHRAASASCCVVLAVVVLLPMPSPGWPPRGWVLAVCDVGQGDALVVNAGDGQAVVVDAGQEPAAVDRCLDRLDVSGVPLLVLTHFHADHVGGLAGVYDGRQVGSVEVTALAEPSSGADAVRRATGGRARVPTYGGARQVGQATVQVLGPLPDAEHHGSATDEGSAPNNASLVLLAEVRGVTMLLTGDAEPEAQALLARSLPGLVVDVLKIPHHGSRHQDLAFLTGLRPRVAVASAGADNDYGHPSPVTLEALREAGTRVFRTDRDGDVLVVAEDGGVGVRTRD